MRLQGERKEAWRTWNRDSHTEQSEDRLNMRKSMTIVGRALQSGPPLPLSVHYLALSTFYGHVD